MSHKHVRALRDYVFCLCVCVCKTARGVSWILGSRRMRLRLETELFLQEELIGKVERISPFERSTIGEKGDM